MTGDHGGGEARPGASGTPVGHEGPPSQAFGQGGSKDGKSALEKLREGIGTLVTAALRRPLDLVSAWQERRYTVRTCAKVLAAYERVHTQHPELAGKALYRQVVMSQAGLDAKAADALIQSAEQSFAEWPNQRELVFRDVAHYMVYDAYMRSYGGRHWTRRHIGRIVESVIPAGL